MVVSHFRLVFEVGISLLKKCGHSTSWDDFKCMF